MTIGPEEGFIRHAGTREAYFQELARMVTGIEQPGEQLRLCARWYHLFNLANAFDLRDVIDEHGQAGAVEAAAEGELVRRVLIEGAEALPANLERLAGGADALRAETAALRAQVARLVEFLCTGADRGGATGLLPCDNAQMAGALQRGRYALDGEAFTYDDGDRLWRRNSRLVARLARIYESLT
jgi:hypothetical protein